MRLIDADALLEKMKKTDRYFNIVFDIEDAPTVGAIEVVVRCKDCKNWDTTWQNNHAPNYHYCPMIDGVRRNDFYCADAERRIE